MVKSTQFVTARGAAKLLDVSPGYVLRALESGELGGERKPGSAQSGRKTLSWTLRRSAVVDFAKARGLTIVGGNGQHVDPSTGEVVELVRTLDQVRVEDRSREAEPVPEPAAAPAPEPEPIAAAPAAATTPDDELRGRYEAARALLRLELAPDMAPTLWAALRAVLNVEARS